jgi:hypothetical protein
MESQQGLSIGSLLDDPPMMTAPSLEKQHRSVSGAGGGDRLSGGDA